MYGKWIAALAGSVVLSVAGIALVLAAEKGPSVIPADSLSYKEIEPGAAMAPLWGDSEKGFNGSFVRFKPGFVCPKHHHSSTLRIVVIDGAYIMSGVDGEKRVRAGDVLVEPAGYMHETRADEAAGCLFYVESLGKFDVVKSGEGAIGAEKKPVADEREKPMIYQPDVMKFKEKEKERGSSMAVIWGDPEKGACGAFVRLKPGADIPLHHHSSGKRLVALQGSWTIASGDGVKRVEKGTYVFEPAHDTHSAKAGPEGALFYMESLDKFDFIKH